MFSFKLGREIGGEKLGLMMNMHIIKDMTYLSSLIEALRHRNGTNETVHDKIAIAGLARPESRG